MTCPEKKNYRYRYRYRKICTRLRNANQPTSQKTLGVTWIWPLWARHHYYPTCHGYFSYWYDGVPSPIAKWLFVFPFIVNWCAHSRRSGPSWAHFILPSSMLLPSAAVGQDPFRPRPVCLFYNCLLVFYSFHPNACKSIISTSFITITIHC